MIDAAHGRPEGARGNIFHPGLWEFLLNVLIILLFTANGNEIIKVTLET